MRDFRVTIRKAFFSPGELHKISFALYQVGYRSIYVLKRVFSKYSTQFRSIGAHLFIIFMVNDMAMPIELDCGQLDSPFRFSEASIQLEDWR